MLLEKKHRLDEANIRRSGVFLDVSIWSLEEHDIDTISGVGAIEVEVTNTRLYPMEYKVVAQGKNIRWETQPKTNQRLSSVYTSSISKLLQVFEVEMDLIQQQHIHVTVETESPRRSVLGELWLSFNTSAKSKLIYRKEDFEHSCSIIIPDLDIANTEFLEYCSRHPEYLHELHWRKFEELLDAIFRNLGYSTELGLGRNDEGIDLRIFQRDDIGEILTLVQAKKYDPKRPIDLQPVAALSAIVNQENAQRGLFVTTSRYLPVARRFAEKEARRLVLADSSDIAKWCDNIINGKNAPNDSFNRTRNGNENAPGNSTRSVLQ